MAASFSSKLVWTKKRAHQDELRIFALTGKSINNSQNANRKENSKKVTETIEQFHTVPHVHMTYKKPYNQN